MRTARREVFARGPCLPPSGAVLVRALRQADRERRSMYRRIT